MKTRSRWPAGAMAVVLAAIGCGGGGATGTSASSSSGSGGAGGGSGGGKVVDPGIVSAESASKDEFETSLAVAPDGTIALSWTIEPNGPGAFPLGYTFSKDGG